VPPDFETGPLDERELAVVAALRAEERTAFQGLRRKLGLHQQALTRTLRRLERQGVVERDARGYALTAQGKSAVKAIVPLATARKNVDLLPVLQALLPPTVTADDVAERLARRWFRDLRWYGRSDATPGEVALSWLTVDTGALVRVRFAHGMAVLEVELAPGERLDRFPAAQAVLKALSELYASGVPQQAA
jgi:DNA-binding HxlR family transcriptional regulator